MTKIQRKTKDPLLAQIHIAKKELSLTDESYRDLLERVTKRRSSKGLSQANKQAVLDEFRRLGWKKPKGNFGISNDPQVRFIFVLWGLLHKAGVVRENTRPAIRSYVSRMTGIADPEFLTQQPDKRAIVVEALKKWCEREGVEYERSR
ncbi:phage protein GemA/Gp16 family protein [Kiloniella litopenaei]|uniref:phage protein GemA/Gp16 family protein n=1 Tax=Kiloniella litopenaei TaxID=1549748 RepID=UPI003BACE065